MTEQTLIEYLKEKDSSLIGEETPTSASWREIANPPFLLDTSKTKKYVI